VTVAAAVAFPAGAVHLTMAPKYGEFVDRGTITVSVGPGDPSRIDCAAGLEHARFGSRIVLIARRLPGTRSEGECGVATAQIGPFPAGTYEVEARVTHVAGDGYDATTQPLTVLPLEGRCNATPELQPSLWAVHVGLRPEDLIQKVASDPAYAASLGNPVVGTSGIYSQDLQRWYATLTYPPLEDVTAITARLYESGEFVSVSRSGYACFSAAPPDFIAAAIEYYHAGLDHYFYTADQGEIAAVDAGKVGPWARTGKSFRVVVMPGCKYSTSDTVVYRFSGIPGKGPSSHFFTRDRAECYAVDKSGMWALEGVPFHASPVAPDGTCAPNPSTFPSRALVPLHRLWRPFGDSNHRFTTEPAVVAEMTAKGWIDEGPAMCVPAAI